MPPQNPPSGEPPRQVRVRGRLQPYLERRRIGRGDYYLLKRVGSPLRERYRAFDPGIGPGGEFFLVQTWPAGPVSEQFLRVLGRLRDDSLPRFWQRNRRGDVMDLVLTWIEGISLVEYLANIRAGKRPPPDPGEVLRLIRGLANAVCRLVHHRQVAHGDIQPTNVVITSHPSRLVLIDFGNAWTTEATATRVEGDGHNPFYAAPEMLGAGRVEGFLADQFSVSVLLYELLTQEIPYDGLGGKAARVADPERARQALLPPSARSDACRALPSSLRAAVDRVTLRGLELRPGDRYADRRAWLDALFATSAHFRLPPAELSVTQRLLTRVVEWFVGPHEHR